MPDIQTALQTALKQWEEPKEQTVQTQPSHQTTPKHPFAVTNNVTRVTFNYVRDNPGKRNGEICDDLEKQGYKRGSVSSLLGQMVMAGLIAREEDRTFRALRPEYEPINLTTLLRHRKGGTRKPVAQTRAMKNYLPTPKPTPASPPEVKVCNSVEDLLNTLTVAQARELFDRLKKMFA